MELSERQIAAISRNYYLSSAMFLLPDLPPQSPFHVVRLLQIAVSHTLSVRSCSGNPSSLHAITTRPCA